MDAATQHAPSTSALASAPIPGEGELVKRIHKGTKSCVECRQRKIRCVWTSPHDAVCVGCKARGRDCVPQLYRRTTNAPKLSAKERISRLEQQIASLTSGTPNEHRPGSSDMSPHTVDPYHEEEEASSEDDDIDNNNFIDSPGPSGPVHLQFLFDSGRASRKDDEHETTLDEARVSKRYLDSARAKLQRWLPLREEVQAVANYATPWMAIYLTLFPSTTSIATREDMLEQYETVIRPDAHPVYIAMFLSIFCLTALQVPDEGIRMVNGREKLAYARGVVHVIETTVMSHTGLALTVEGIEVAVMFVRVKLSLGGVRSLWITLRRTIALAELIGLPRAWHVKDKSEAGQISSPGSTTSSHRDRLTQKAGLWQAICSTDRLASLMFNLPAGTSMHKFPRKRVVSPDGEVLPREYMFELATVALTVQELDEAYTLEPLKEEVYEKVLSQDRALRAMKNSIPQVWWTEYTSPFSTGHLVRFWHHYMTVRIHLPWALKEEGDEYRYSRTICIESSEQVCRRYDQVRRGLPENFFICRIMDMQVFTAVVFLVLLSINQQQRDNPNLQQQQLHLGYVRQVLETWKLYSNGMMGPFLKEATHATESLVNILQDPAGMASSQNLSLRIPLLGRVRFGRQEPRSRQVRQENLAQLPGQPMNSITTMATADPNLQVVGAGSAYPQPLNNGTYDTPMANTMPWLMQLDMNTSSLQDPFFVSEDLGSFDMWNGLENMPMNFGNTPMQ